MSEWVSFDVEGPLGWIRINHPPVNALSRAGFEQLGRCLAQAAEDDEVRVVLVTGAGPKVFIAGIDIHEVQSMTIEEMIAFNSVSRWVFSQVERMSKPVIAVVNGAAYGAGCELALACDFRVAGLNAVFALPEVGLGIIPGGGGTQRLTRLVGVGKSKEMILLGRPVKALEAKDLGLVTEVVEPEQLAEAARRMGLELAKKSKVALAQAKRAIQAAMDLPLEAGLSLENEAFMAAFNSVDRHEGMTAFLEKRAPVFQ